MQCVMFVYVCIYRCFNHSPPHFFFFHGRWTDFKMHLTAYLKWLFDLDLHWQSHKLDGGTGRKTNEEPDGRSAHSSGFAKKTKKKTAFINRCNGCWGNEFPWWQQTHLFNHTSFLLHISGARFGVGRLSHVGALNTHTAGPPWCRWQLSAVIIPGLGHCIPWRRASPYFLIALFAFFRLVELGKG